MSEKKEKMVFDAAYQPQVRTKRDTKSIMIDVMIALVPSLGVAVWQFGAECLIPVFTSMAACVLFEWLYRKFMKKDCTVGDCSALVTGLLLACVLPAGTKWWIPVVGALFAIVVVKQLYGGIGKNFLNPALAGRAFLLASYPLFMSTWQVPNSLKGAVDGLTMATPLSYLYSGAEMPGYLSFRSLLIGTVPGCLGELSAIALLAGGIYLLARKVITWRIPVAFIGTVAVLTLIFGHEGYSNVDWMVYNLLSGGLLLGAIFMATDYVTSPVTGGAQLIYGFGCGALTVLIRYFGGFPEGGSYAILIMNLCSWALDKNFRRPQFGVTKEDLKAAKEAKKKAKEG